MIYRDATITFELSESNRLAIASYLSRQQLLLTLKKGQLQEAVLEVGENDVVEVTINDESATFGIWEVRASWYYGLSGLLLQSSDVVSQLKMSEFREPCWIAIGCAGDSDEQPLGTLVPQRLIITPDLDMLHEDVDDSISPSRMSTILWSQLMSPEVATT